MEKEEPCVPFEDHMKQLVELVNGSEERLRWWMLVLLFTCIISICLVYYFLNKEVNYYKLKATKFASELKTLRAQVKGGVEGVGGEQLTSADKPDDSVVKSKDE